MNGVATWNGDFNEIYYDREKHRKVYRNLFGSSTFPVSFSLWFKDKFFSSYTSNKHQKKQTLSVLCLDLFGVIGLILGPS